MREFLTFFNGNELIIGVILATWMTLTGLGAYLGRFFRNLQNVIRLILVLQGSLAFLPIITVLELHFLSHIIFTPGVMIGISEAFYYTLIILSPFCIISGMLFILFVKAGSIETRFNHVGSVYAWESTGSMVGGLILNFVLIWFLSTFQSLYVVMALGVISTIMLSIKSRNFLISGIIVFVFLMFNFLYLTNDLDKAIREISFPTQIVENIDETPYGILVVTNHVGQENYYENNNLMASSGDVAIKEESVHFAMVQHENPENILVMSGIATGIMSEIMKYDVNRIDYVDKNPGIIRLAKKYFNVDSSVKVHLFENDPIRFLRKTESLYDIVLMNLPKPTTIQYNRFYTVEFFSMLKSKTNQGAIICLSMPSSSNYLNEEARIFLSIIVSTLKTEFKNVLVLPGTDDFILASDNELRGNVAELIEMRGIKNEYVNKYYIQDDLLIERSNKIMQQLDFSAPVNRDFKPIGYQSSIKLWLRYFNFRYWIPAILIVFFCGFFYFKSNSLNKTVFAAGFAGTSIEFLLLLVFQVLFGYAYIAAGMFFMVFMAGLAVGSMYWNILIKNHFEKWLQKLLVIIFILTIILPVFFKLFRIVSLPDIVILFSFLVILFIISLLTGAIFSISTLLGKKTINNIASDAYGLDLLGSAAGAIIMAVYLVPILGFQLSLVGTGFICLLTWLFLFIDFARTNKC